MVVCDEFFELLGARPLPVVSRLPDLCAPTEVDLKEENEVAKIFWVFVESSG